MKVSFIIPVYKPDYLLFGKCLTALKKQSYKDYEVIICLDGEDKDAENTIADNLPKAKVIKLEHGGVQKARNAGAKEATGDIFWFWDCDCIIEPDSCKTFVDEFKANPGIDFIYSGYKFINENGGIASEPFDPWLLRCANYISTCFPMRRGVFPGWDESLKSLQDWDIWLTIVEKGGKGLFLQGFAFSTAMPSGNSISAQGCTNQEWLNRVRPVKVKHGIPERKVCVTSVTYKPEGIRLAKLIDADYMDFPHFKPNTYDTVIQVGFSLNPQAVRIHADIFKQPLRKKVIFWTAENITEINNAMSLKALTEYSEALAHTTQFVEDLAAKKIMEKAGFNVSILPLPMENTDQPAPLPATPRILVDITEDHRQVVNCLEHSLPDFKFDYLTAAKPVSDYTALLSLAPERTMSFQVKRMLLAGRNVISNIQAPFCGYVSDNQDLGKYISEMVDTIRKRAKRDTAGSVSYWRENLGKGKLIEVLK